MELVLVKPLTLLPNQMLSSGIFPDGMELSKMIPLFKKKDTQDLASYRLISLLTSFSKLFENVIFKQLMHSSLNENKLLSANSLFSGPTYLLNSQH